MIFYNCGNSELFGNNEDMITGRHSKKRLREVFRLRYEVYCKECNFIRKEDYPDGIEHDEYDPSSLHFVASDKEGLIGTVRMVLDSPLGFPLEKYCKGSLDKDSPPHKNLAEVSRLIVSKKLHPRSSLSNTKKMLPVAFALYRSIYQESKMRDIKHLCALMEEDLHRLLLTYGFIFRPIGEEVDFYGLVKPYLASIEEMERSTFAKSPAILRYLSEGLAEEYRAKILP